jgi:hypothetical protein
MAPVANAGVVVGSGFIAPSGRVDGVKEAEVEFLIEGPSQFLTG